MLISSSAIVLHLTRVSDTRWMLHLFTREYGRVQYMVYGSRKKMPLYQPLTLLQVEADHRDNRDVQQIRDVSATYVAGGIAEDIRRRTEALFIAEMLFRTLTHPMADPVLYDWLEEVVRALDTRPDPENVHLEFLVGLVDQLGFTIDMEAEGNAPFRAIGGPAPIGDRQRRELLALLMQYYRNHLPDFHEPKSLDVMYEVFH